MSMETEARGGRLGDWKGSRLAEFILVQRLPRYSLLWKNMVTCGAEWRDRTGKKGEQQTSMCYGPKGRAGTANSSDRPVAADQCSVHAQSTILRVCGHSLAQLNKQMPMLGPCKTVDNIARNNLRIGNAGGACVPSGLRSRLVLTARRHQLCNHFLSVKEHRSSSSKLLCGAGINTL